MDALLFFKGESAFPKTDCKSLFTITVQGSNPQVISQPSPENHYRKMSAVMAVENYHSLTENRFRVRMHCGDA